MSIVKSFSVGNGDMFYIQHGSDSFTIIDCCINDQNKSPILKEISEAESKKTIRRFISTHPDQDHFEGLVDLNKALPISNFYCVKNETIKEPATEDFNEYVKLRDSKAAFFLYKNCSRKWLNECDSERSSAGINVLWPDIENAQFKEALKIAKEGGSPNNISTILRYSIEKGPSFLWFGDLETEFMESITDQIKLQPTDVLFAPHHGRKSGRLPTKWLDKLNPKIIVIGEADSEDLYYYSAFNTIKQNSAGHIEFHTNESQLDVFVSQSSYSEEFLIKRTGHSTNSLLYYVGSIDIK